LRRSYISGNQLQQVLPLLVKFARRNQSACSKFATADAWDRMTVMDAA
jgi:hypothetical protein